MVGAGPTDIGEDQLGKEYATTENLQAIESPHEMLATEVLEKLKVHHDLQKERVPRDNFGHNTSNNRNIQSDSRMASPRRLHGQQLSTILTHVLLLALSA